MTSLTGHIHTVYGSLHLLNMYTYTLWNVNMHRVDKDMRDERPYISSERTWHDDSYCNGKTGENIWS
jgi:fumarate reductase subunit D